MISEAALADMIRGQSLAQWAADLVTPLGLLVHSINTPLQGDTGLVVDGVPIPAQPAW